MHSCIEKEKQRILKSGPLFVSHKDHQGQPYSVKELDTLDFIDWKKISKAFCKNFNVNMDGEKIIWNDIKILKTIKRENGKVFYKTSYQDEDFKILDTREKMRSKVNNNIELQPCYTQAPVLPHNKKADLLSLCNDNLIPVVHQDFY